MKLYLNSRYLSMEVFKNLDTLMTDYYNQLGPNNELKWSPITTDLINSTDLYYNAIEEYFKWYNTELNNNYTYDDTEVQYIKNVLYYSKGKSRVLSLFNQLIKPRDSYEVSVNFNYDYDFPELFLIINSYPQLNPGILINKLTDVIYYLLFFDENTFRILINTINMIIEELVIEYVITPNMEYKFIRNTSDYNIDHKLFDTIQP